MNSTHWLVKTLVIGAHALVGWGLCGAIIGIGRSVTTMNNTLIVHAFGAPIIFALLSLSYFRFFHYTNPLQTAALFLGIIVGLDFLLVAPFIEKDPAMYTSLLGTWVPFGLIFLSTWLTGLVVTDARRAKPVTNAG